MSVPTVHHRVAEVEGHAIFYREAGPPSGPHVVLLHGAPASSSMFRHVIPLPLLAAWGANDEIFSPDGARAFRRDLPGAKVHLLDAGHFALESELNAIAQLMRAFPRRPRAHPHR